MNFRKMRRFKQELNEKETLEILMHGKTGILGVVGDYGYPYTVPVNYVYENGKIYFHGQNQDINWTQSGRMIKFLFV